MVKPLPEVVRELCIAAAQQAYENAAASGLCDEGAQEAAIGAMRMLDLSAHGKSELEALRVRLQEFSAARDWDKFHSPKNLSMALIAEAAELVEHFQWLTEAESEKLPPERKHDVEMELADILIYLIKLAERLDVDLLRAAYAKIEQNEKRFPADSVRGKAT